MAPRGPSVDELVEAFPMVDREKLAKIRESVDNLTLRTAADVLDEAASMGKVPQKNYQQLAAAAADHETLDLDPDDPLDEPPDADPSSPHNADRGRQAKAHLQATDYEAQAREVAARGTISDMVDLLNTVNKWANEALLDPNETSLPPSAKEPAEVLGDAMVGRVDALAARGEAERLRAAQEAIVGLQNRALREAVDREINQKLRLLEASGSGYEAARERVLSEDNTPGEVRRLYQDALENADITYQQAQELGEDVTAWLEEYRDLTEQEQRQRQQQPNHDVH